MTSADIDCIVIGYNEIPFAHYERFLAGYGEDTEAYRDLKFSFVDVEGQKKDYMDLLNHLAATAFPERKVREFRSGDIPNLAAVYLTNFLLKCGFRAKYINLFQCEKDKLKDYLSCGPVCVAITTTFYVVNLPLAEMIQFVRNHNSSVKIVVGGPLIANHARNSRTHEELTTILDDIGADIYVIEGEGELTLSRLVEALKSRSNISHIPNIVYREGRELRRTVAVREGNSMDLNAIDWRRFAGESLGVTLQTRTARSCSFKCSFCNYPARAGPLSLTSLEVLEKELESMLDVAEPKQVVFIDDTFNVPFPRFKEICRLMIRRKFPFTWYSYFRCSNSDEEAIDLMAASGCKGVFLGIESGSPTILKNMNKAATIEKYAQGIKWLRERKIMTFGSFIAGFPGESSSTINETIDFITANKPDFYRCQLWYCEPGTPIEQQRDVYGIKGSGFVWSHQTMESLEAMDHIDRMFLSVKTSVWLPQWSFDFWSIPYLIGRGISIDQFKRTMEGAQRLLALNIASVPAEEKEKKQREYMAELTGNARHWDLITADQPS